MQYQFCHSRAGASDYCTELIPLPGTVKAHDFPEASDIQLAALQLLVTSSGRYDTAAAAGTLSKVQDLADISGGQILSLPNDQWVQEVIAWEKYIWASM